MEKTLPGNLGSVPYRWLHYRRSMQGMRSSAYGFIPGVFLGLNTLLARCPKTLSVPIAGLFMLAILEMQFPGYPDARRGFELVDNGPYQGIWATSEQNSFLKQFALDLKSTSDSPKRSLSYSSFAYLFSFERPMPLSLWKPCICTENLPCDQYYERKIDELGTVVFFGKRGQDSFRQEVEQTCKLVAERDFKRLYKNYFVYDCSIRRGSRSYTVRSSSLRGAGGS
jgi:hypothetical protein